MNHPGSLLGPGASRCICRSFFDFLSLRDFQTRDKQHSTHPHEALSRHYLLRSSSPPSPDTGSLIAHFPFKVFLGTFLDDNDTSTAQTIEFDDLSVEFWQAVVKHTEGLVEMGPEIDKSWDRVVNPHNECVYHKAFGIETCYWTAIYPRFYTCMTCANQRRMYVHDVWELRKCGVLNLADRDVSPFHSDTELIKQYFLGRT